jgi:hypothetical protein
MSNSTCLNCGISEQERPLLTLKFQAKELFICPQYMPILIHKSHDLVDKIPGFQPTASPSNYDIN